MTRFAIYVIGLVFIIGAVWVFLTQTEFGQALPGGVALAIILLLVGIGVMASTRTLNGHTERRVVHEDGGTVGADRYGDRDHRVERYEERRYE